MSSLASQSVDVDEGDFAALRGVDMHRPETFPMEALLRTTTLERSQAEALQAMLTRPVALIQGPPGSGKVRWELHERDWRRGTCNTLKSPPAVL